MTCRQCRRRLRVSRRSVAVVCCKCGRRIWLREARLQMGLLAAAETARVLNDTRHYTGLTCVMRLLEFQARIAKLRMV